MIALTDEENRSYENQNRCHVCRKLVIEDNEKVRDPCHFTGKYRGAAHSKCNMNYKIKDIPIAFHNLSLYACHPIIKELANEFDGEFECLGENTEKYITFSVKVNKKIAKKDKDGGERIVNIPYRLQFIDSYRFMSASLLDHIDNLSNGLHNNNNNNNNNKYTNCKSGLDYMTTKDGILIFRCFECKKNYEIDFVKELINKFSNTYDFCKGDINEFILSLTKDVCPYEYMDSWNRFSETSLPDKKDFYSCLNMENITDIECRHATRVFSEFKMNNLVDYHDLYVQSDMLLLADIFEYFRNMSLRTYELDPAYFLSLPGFAWHACLKITGVKLELITDTNMLLMIESGMHGGICDVIRSYAEANNKYMDNYDKNK